MRSVTLLGLLGALGALRFGAATFGSLLPHRMLLRARVAGTIRVTSPVGHAARVRDSTLTIGH